MGNCTVVNKYKEKYDVYVGRGSLLGNPFPLDEFGREECIKNFKYYFCHLLFFNPIIKDIIEEYKEKGDLKLGCFCKPKSCHADFIAQVINDDFDYNKSTLNELLNHYGFVEKGWAPRLPTTLLDTVDINNPIDAFFTDVVDFDIKKAASAPLLTNIINIQSTNAIKRMYAYRAFNAISDDKILTIDKTLTFAPGNDGRTHINAYSKSKTALGRALSNFGYTPFIHEEYGRFETMEGYWYWCATGKRLSALRSMRGFEAKAYGAKSKRVENPDFKVDIRTGIRAKLLQNFHLVKEVRDVGLPVAHYYEYGGKVVWPKDTFFITLLTEYLDALIGEL